MGSTSNTSLSESPAALPPHISTPSYDDPADMNPLVISIFSIFAGLATICVILRIISKVVGKQRFTVDDGFSIAGLVLCHVFASMAVRAGGFRPAWNLPATFYSETYFKLSVAGSVFLGPAILCVRTAIMLLQRRIFVPQGSTKVLFWTAFTLNVLVPLTAAPLFGIGCSPRHGKSWSVAIITQCQVIWPVYGVVLGAFGVAIDIFIIVWPLPTLARLHVTRSHKIRLFITFTVGIFAIVASILALAYRIQSTTSKDIGIVSAKLFSCMFAEMYLGVMVGCAPALVSLWRAKISQASPFSSLVRRQSPSESATCVSDSLDMQRNEEKVLQTRHVLPDGAILEQKVWTINENKRV